MDFLKVLPGNEYPKKDSLIDANEERVVVFVSMTLAPEHVALDNPGYIETKFKKLIPILKGIGTYKDKESDEQKIIVKVEVPGKFRNINNLNHLVRIAGAICEIAEDRLSEPGATKNIGLDCKPFVINEPEEKHEDA